MITYLTCSYGSGRVLIGDLYHEHTSKNNFPLLIIGDPVTRHWSSKHSALLWHRSGDSCPHTHLLTHTFPHTSTRTSAPHRVSHFLPHASRLGREPGVHLHFTALRHCMYAAVGFMDPSGVTRRSLPFREANRDALVLRPRLTPRLVCPPAQEPAASRMGEWRQTNFLFFSS